jgi:hypothetical protein
VVTENPIQSLNMAASSAEISSGAAPPNTGCKYRLAVIPLLFAETPLRNSTLIGAGNLS